MNLIVQENGYVIASDLLSFVESKGAEKGIRHNEIMGSQKATQRVAELINLYHLQSINIDNYSGYKKHGLVYTTGVGVSKKTFLHPAYVQVFIILCSPKTFILGISVVADGYIDIRTSIVKTYDQAIGSLSGPFMPEHGVYVMRISGGGESFIKIGVSKRRHERARELSKKGYLAEIISFMGCENAKESLAMEGALHARFEKLRHIPMIEFPGWTECFEETVLNYLSA